MEGSGERMRRILGETAKEDEGTLASTAAEQAEETPLTNRETTMPQLSSGVEEEEEVPPGSQQQPEGAPAPAKSAPRRPTPSTTPSFSLATGALLALLAGLVPMPGLPVLYVALQTVVYLAAGEGHADKRKATVDYLSLGLMLCGMSGDSASSTAGALHRSLDVANGLLAFLFAFLMSRGLIADLLSSSALL